MAWSESPATWRADSPSSDWPRQAPREERDMQLCIESQEKLCRAAHWAAARIGPGHKAVEAAKRQIQDLRARKDRLCFTSTLRWHKANLAFDLRRMEQGEDIGQFQALRDAEADLGPAHEIVASARRAAQMLRTRKKVRAQKELEAKHFHDLNVTAESNNLRMLADRIQAAARCLGPAHPVVESGRQEFLQQRRTVQRRQCGGQEVMTSSEVR
ncbi:unnamed protein product [Effrenium voratum]|nr:unnamed protein product [Effrenium voratum]